MKVVLQPSSLLSYMYLRFHPPNICIAATATKPDHHTDHVPRTCTLMARLERHSVPNLTLFDFCSSAIVLHASWGCSSNTFMD